MPLLFRVFNAITGTREQPATHRMPSDRRHVLLHLANRADNDTGIARGSNDGLTNDTGLGASTVRRSLVDLIDHGWISRAGSHGPPGREVPLFQIHDAGTKPWPEASARDRDPPSPRTGVSAAVGGVSQEPHPCQPYRPGVSAAVGYLPVIHPSYLPLYQPRSRSRAGSIGSGVKSSSCSSLP